MDIDIDLVHLECVGIKREKHFLDNPVVVQCGHFMCSSCVHNENENDDTVQCGICKVTKTFNFAMNPATLLMNKQIEACLGRLFNVVLEKCHSTLSEIKYTYPRKKESIGLQFEYIKEEIEIKAESLKNDIDELCKTIYSDLQVDMELLTYLDYNDKSKKDLIIPKFKEKIPIYIRGFGLCVIPNDQLIVSDYHNKCILVFDKDIQTVKTVKEINRNSFEPFGAATNGIDRVYICEIRTKKILMTDLEFKLMSTFESDDLKDPNGLCYSNNLLYVCDYDSNTIHVIQQNFTNKTLYELDYKPWYIQVIDKIACIRHFDERCISFYKLPEFTLKYRYEGHNGSICIGDSKFYEFYQPTSTFYCYNSDGTLCYKQKIELLDETGLSIFDPIIFFKEKFVLSSNNSFELILS